MTLELSLEGGRRKGWDRNKLKLRVRPTQRTPRGISIPGRRGRVKLREQPMRIPSCEVLGAGQLAQTLTFPTLTQ